MDNSGSERRDHSEHRLSCNEAMANLRAAFLSSGGIERDSFRARLLQLPKPRFEFIGLQSHIHYRLDV